MKLFKDKLTDTHGYFEDTAEAVDTTTANKAIDYKKNVCKNYMAQPPEQIDKRLIGSEFYVTRKYDGELNVIFYDGTDTFIINRSGRTRTGLPCTNEAGKLLAAAGIKQAIIPSELYVSEENGRTRVFDVLEALADKNALNKLKLAPFDIIELNDDVFKPSSYEDTHNKLNEIFGKSDICRQVRYQKASSKSEVKDLYSKWVEEEGAEGLIVRSELPIVFKIKPRFTIDVAVVGFSEGTGDQKGQARSLLLAMMPEEGHYQIIGRTGNGFSDEFKKELFEKLTPMTMESKYIETDSNHVAFHMIKPELVIELIVNDVLFETSSGPVMNTILEIINGEYVRRINVPGVSFVYPIFDRFRDDKTCNATDVRLSQVNEITAMPVGNTVESNAVSAKSTLVHREVYKKETGTKLMVQKFMVWKTGKESTHDYPAYVFHYTNFSSERKDPLQREVAISDDYDQIMKIQTDSVAENVKKGWIKVE